MAERLQKIISQYGIASRRQAEQMILDGQVRLNGAVVDELGTKADPNSDRIEVNGKLLRGDRQPDQVYLLLNKPRGFICTRSDPKGRRTVMDLLPKNFHHLYPVGRLDYDSSGAILLTNDGDLANRLLHPRHHVIKTYMVWVRGNPSHEKLAKWRQGVMLDGKPTLPAKVKVIANEAGNSKIKLEIKEGRNRQIRRVAEHLGLEVLELRRVGIANLTLKDIAPGRYRLLNAQEVEQLYADTN
ncbi:ribosomal large subunit pseudouridine synthase B [Thalassoporum mexicanum PCC 7367]|uniref:pseudouridine synthase n=1 Tax=Thalassoporum mexicanum TaxID=3457544 RepID=UPI00029FD254|nr:pseudouridine synthase [Pseudanabaena sp. PCC 7367]AFY69978.1 ribosomal large subunit pseudouridine synthase B [Pseudanabaena sp. PCC 7367]